VNEGWQTGRKTHDETKVDVAQVVKRVEQCIDEHVAVACLACYEIFFAKNGYSRCEGMNEPARYDEDQQHPKCGNNGNDEVYGQMRYILQCVFALNGTADDVNGDKKGEAVEDGT